MKRWLVLALYTGTEVTGAIMLRGFVKRSGLADERLTRTTQRRSSPIFPGRGERILIAPCLAIGIRPLV